MQEKRLKKGDTVKVIAGKEKGKTGKILSTIPDKAAGRRREDQPDQET